MIKNHSNKAAFEFFFKRKFYYILAVLTVSLFAGAAIAQPFNFNTIAENILNSVSEIPVLISGLSHIVGLLLGVTGILKIKDHVENPDKTPLKDGAIRLLAGGSLFALPLIMEAMTNTFGSPIATVPLLELKPVNPSPK